MQENPSQYLFNEIIKQGLIYIDDAISSKQVENYYLEFKSTEKNDYTGERKLLTFDKKNYARAISAFGNSEGGVLIWGIKTGTADADYADSKSPIRNVSKFLGLLEGFTSILTSPPHPKVENKIILEDQINDIGYVATHINKSNRRPFQVINEKDFRYYIRAGSNSSPASDSFIRSLFGREPQPNVFFTWGFDQNIQFNDNVIKLDVGFILHNGGENVAENINGYILIAGDGLALEINRNFQDCFSYYSSKLAGMKVGFMAKDDFKLGVEQEVLPLTIHISLGKPSSEYGIWIKGLVNCDNQITYRIDKRINKKRLEEIYDSYTKDNKYDIVGAIFGNEELN
jgi:hypothetical protein